ncbi:hypothetical protein KIL84_004275 [Mauremys mutica]|uniref:Uncharacterized protein n=1 Tax=Mauremys mutica TaxID=74926 RepID=A0A9D3XP21_9SAUR|nr:hypothetical protein KIL84_004275 [Mauremys mutica]
MIYCASLVLDYARFGVEAALGQEKLREEQARLLCKYSLLQTELLSGNWCGVEIPRRRDCPACSLTFSCQDWCTAIYPYSVYRLISNLKVRWYSTSLVATACYLESPMCDENQLAGNPHG